MLRSDESEQIHELQDFTANMKSFLQRKHIHIILCMYDYDYDYDYDYETTRVTGVTRVTSN